MTTEAKAPLDPLDLLDNRPSSYVEVATYRIALETFQQNFLLGHDEDSATKQ
jgi:hypothetical protein